MRAARRGVVVTGVGLVSSIGRTREEAAESLRTGRSGIRAAPPDWAEKGLRSRVAGDVPEGDLRERFDRQALRFMTTQAVLGATAAREAFEDAGLGAAELSDPGLSLIVGTGAGGSTIDSYEMGKTVETKGARKLLPIFVPRTMGSALSANLGVLFKIHGASYCVSSACSTSAHAIMIGLDLIRAGRAHTVVVGGAEEVTWIGAVAFDAMRALSSAFNETPERASRPLDRKRDGFVFSGGAAMLVLEEAAHAKARGARAYAEVRGAGATCDGADMVAPSGEGAVRCMRLALEDAGIAPADVGYINLHGTSTPVGDTAEIGAIREVFGTAPPPFSSTKSMTGHGLGAAGALEASFCLLAMRDGILPPNLNLEDPEPCLEGLPIVRVPTPAKPEHVLSNSFGFGGTNAALVFSSAS